MQNARIPVLVGFFLTVAAVVTYRILSPAFLAPDLKQAQVVYEVERLQMERAQLQRLAAFEAERLRVKQARLQRDADLTVYGVLGLLSVAGFAALILAAGHSHAKVRQASIYIARIGAHSEIPIHHKDLQRFYPIAVNLSLAEMEASASAAHDKAYQISRQMLADITDATRAFTPPRHKQTQAGFLALPAGIPAATATPTMADLLRTGQIAPGKPLILGFDRQGQPITHPVQALKSMGVAGWQGSGKTRSLGYLIASCVLGENVQVSVLDPHKAHPESLSALLQPLIATGRISSVNPFDTSALLTSLHQTLDRRLSGVEPCTPGILLVIDELERLATMACFDELLRFLERCTTETRKANMTFIGCAHKWTARHFGGRADIRACLNTLLIHKTKPSQAALLLEDAHDKQLVKQLQRPGDAILMTDFSPATVVTIPFCTLQDMRAVADLVGQTAASSQQAADSRQQTADSDRQDANDRTQYAVSSIQKPVSNTQPPASGVQRPATGQMILLGQHQHPRRPEDLTAEQVRCQIAYRKQQDPEVTQAAIARQAGITPARLSRILTGRTEITPNEQHQLYQVLFPTQARTHRTQPTAMTA